jgi:hypothetical protein
MDMKITVKSEIHKFFSHQSEIQHQKLTDILLELTADNFGIKSIKVPILSPNSQTFGTTQNTGN